MTTNTVTQEKWYNKNWLVIVLCILFFPVGLYALWKSTVISKGWKIIGTVIIGIVVIAAVANEKNETQPVIVSSSTNETPKKENPLPILEQDFIDIIDKYKREYNDADNELKKSAVRSKRGDALKLLLKNQYTFDNWIVIVNNMETTHGGKAIFSVKIPDTNIEITTTNNEFSDIMSGTLIEQTNPLYQIISELKPGDKIRVSGEFLQSPENDFIDEMSLTEAGSMKSPSFICKFTYVAK